MTNELERQLANKNRAYQALLQSYQELQNRVESQARADRQRYQNLSEQEKWDLQVRNAELTSNIVHQQVKQENQRLEQELATERETTQQALQTSQEWHERQKQEIIAEWKQKLTNLIQQRKSQIEQEITLLREILSHEQQ